MRIVILISLLFLTGCASTKISWCHPSNTQPLTDKIVDACNSTALILNPTPFYPALRSCLKEDAICFADNSMKLSEYHRDITDRKNKVWYSFKNCMQKSGYYSTEQQCQKSEYLTKTETSKQE